MFRESEGNVVVFYVSSIHVDGGQEGLSIFITGNDEVIVVWILVVSLFVTDSTQIVRVILNCKVDIVIERFRLSGKLVHSSGDFLEISVFASSCQDDTFG